MTLGTLVRFNLRYYRRHKILSLLCLMGISLGVGIVIAVELINGSALSSFASSVDFLAGKATHSVLSAYGRIEERHFADIWRHPSVKAASPMVEGMTVVLETGNEPIRFVGVDPFLDADFRSLAPRGAGEAPLVEFLTADPPRVCFSARLTDRYRLRVGDTVTVLCAGIEKKVMIAGHVPDAGEVWTGDNLAVLDIAAAQDLFGRRGYLDRIDVIVSGDGSELAKAIPSSLMLTTGNDRKATLEAMLYSFQLNLAAMSLLALFVGVFLIYNFSMFSVLSRRQDMSLLLTLGSDRGGLVGAFLVESLLLGLAGSIVGIAFGYGIAWYSIEKVSSTITEIYFYVAVKQIQLTWPVALSGVGVGFVATLLGTGLPALEVASTPPVLGLKRRSIEDRAHALKGLLLLAGTVLFGASLVAAWASRISIYWGFAGAFGVTLAFALFTPSILALLSHHLGTALRCGAGSLTGFLAARTIQASLSRTSIAVAALAVALSMTIGVDTMIYSFRESVDAWLTGALQGDLYISPATTKWDHPLPDTLVEELKKDPRIDAVERYSNQEIFLDGKPARLRVIDGEVLKTRTRFVFLKGPVAAEAWAQLIAGGVFVSESLGYRFGLRVGDEIKLATPEGLRPFRVVAVVRDYSSDRGTIQMHREIYEGLWKDYRIQSVALFLKPGQSRDEVRQWIIERFPGLDRTIVSNTKMKHDILVIFDKTFAPTATLKGISLLVALLGVATALMAILMERSREMTVLSHLGLTVRELATMNVWQALLMGLVAFLIAIVCGSVLTYIIVYAINYRSFGWSVDIHAAPAVLVKTALLTITACLAASLYPTVTLMRKPSAMSLSEE